MRKRFAKVSEFVRSVEWKKLAIDLLWWIKVGKRAYWIVEKILEWYRYFNE